MASRGDIMRHIGSNTDAVNVKTVTTYKFTATTKADKKRIAEGNYPAKMGVLIELLSIKGYPASNIKWLYDENAISFEVSE